MHLLIITSHFWPEEFRINELAAELHTRGYQITVMTGIPNYPQGKYFSGYGLMSRRKECWNGINILRIPVIPRGSGSRIRLTINYLSSLLTFSIYSLYHGRQRFDGCFVFATSPTTIAIPAVFIRYVYRTPVVLWVLDLWPENLKAAGAISNPIVLSSVRRIMKWIYLRADHILVASQSFTDSVRNVASQSVSIQYIPNWVESSLQCSGNKSTIALPDLPDAFIVMYAGNIGVAQDWDKVVAAALLLKDQPDVHWLIVGDGRDAVRFKRNVNAENLNHCIHFIGSCSPEVMPSIYAKANALLVTLKSNSALSRTVPGKLQSCLYVGIPVIASLDGESARIVEEAGAGVACSAGDSTALAKAVMHLKDLPPEERVAMGVAGRQYSEIHFSRERIINAIDQAMRRVIDQ